MMFRISETEISVSCRDLQLRLIDLVKTGCGVRSTYLCNFIFGEVLRNLEVLGRLTAACENNEMVYLRIQDAVIDAFRCAFKDDSIQTSGHGVDLSFSDDALDDFLDLGFYCIGKSPIGSLSYRDVFFGNVVGYYTPSTIRAISRIGMLHRMIEAGVSEICISID